MKKQIIRREVPIAPLLEQSDLPPVLKSIYAARAIENVSELSLSLNDLLPYHSLTGITQAANLIRDAIIKQQHIMIVGDFDADGATSTAVAVRALKQFGAAQVSYMVPNRFSDGYGLTEELVQAAKSRRPDMIITVDNGIANHQGVFAAKQAGITVVITDHHLPAPTLPKADVIVNPNQAQDDFPSKNLAGVGVIFYVMLAVRKALLAIDWFKGAHLAEPNLANLLDIVALGTVADLVPLDRNNRIIVSQGLRRIRGGRCVPAIAALLELSRRDLREAVAADLGFAVAARLNAAGRMDDMSLGIECLLTDDPHRAREIAKQLDQLNMERRAVEQGMQTQAFTLMEKITGHLQGDVPKGLCLYDNAWHQGVIGILASRIKERFNRPTIIFAPGLSGEIKGSARSIAGFHIRDMLALVNSRHPGLILKFGGHAMAAGLTIAMEKFQVFNEAFVRIANEQLTDMQLAHVIYSDGELAFHDFEMTTAEVVRNVMPWGQHFPEPVFDNQFEILEQRIVGDKHLKLKLQLNGKKNLDAILFFADLKSWPNHRCRYVRAVYRLDINEYQNIRKLQLMVDYLEPLAETHMI